MCFGGEIEQRRKDQRIHKASNFLVEKWMGPLTPRTPKSAFHLPKTTVPFLAARLGVLCTGFVSFLSFLFFGGGGGNQCLAWFRRDVKRNQATLGFPKLETTVSILLWRGLKAVPVEMAEESAVRPANLGTPNSVILRSAVPLPVGCPHMRGNAW